MACPSLLRMKLFGMQAARTNDRTVLSLQFIGPYKMPNFNGSVRRHTILLRHSAYHEHSWMWSPNTFTCATPKFEYYAAV
jgi:hypothetical protein